MTKKTTKSAFITSSISLLLCFAMLLGTTFAWFTDSVTSANNIIKSGNLDIELYYMNDETTTWQKVDANTNVFKEATLWEPGHTEVVKLKVINEGSLALKYQFGVNVASETGSINAAGEDFKLSDYIKYGIVDGEQNYNREEAIKAVETTSNNLNVAYDSVINLPVKTDGSNANEKVVTMVVYMPTSVGNEANYGKNQAIPTINLGINVYATQLASEDDSFGNDYDENAKSDKPAPTITVTSAAEFTTALSNITEPTVIDATGVSVDINQIATSEVNGKMAYNITGDVTIKNLSVVGSYRGGNYIFLNGNPRQEIIFENCTFEPSGRSMAVGFQGVEGGVNSVVYNNCTFKGPIVVESTLNPTLVATYNNCTFTKHTSGNNYVMAYGGVHNFNGCTFDYTGVTQSSMGTVNTGCINAVSDSDGSNSTTVTLNNCTRINCGTRTYGTNSTLTIQ